MPKIGTPPDYLREFEGTPKSRSVTTGSTDANQDIGSYKPPAGKDYIVTSIVIQAYLTTLDETAALLGTLKIKWDGSTILGPYQASNTSSGALFGFTITIPKGLRFEGDGTKELEAQCTPVVATAIKWIVEFIGYLRTR